MTYRCLGAHGLESEDGQSGAPFWEMGGRLSCAFASEAPENKRLWVRAMSIVLGVLVQRGQKAYSSFHTAVRGNKWLQLEVSVCHRADVLLGKLRPREKNASRSVLRAGPHHPGQRPLLLVRGGGGAQSTEKGHNDMAACVTCGNATLLRSASDRSEHCAKAPQRNAGRCRKQK